MKALSIKPPWAHAIAALGKRVENRTWTTNYRGPVLIHASSSMTRLDMENLNAAWGAWVDPEWVVRGAIVATADLVDVTTDARKLPQGQKKWRVGPYYFVLANVKTLREPIPASGRLGLWTPPPALVNLVKNARKSAQ